MPFYIFRFSYFYPYFSHCILISAFATSFQFIKLIAYSNVNWVVQASATLFVKHFPKLVREGHVYAAMPPLYRIDAGKQIFYALDDNEKDAISAKIEKENKRVKIQIQRFKGLGEMNPKQLRETTMQPDTRRLIQLTLDNPLQVTQTMDMLLSKKRASDRKSWLEEKGNLANV